MTKDRGLRIACRSLCFAAGEVVGDGFCPGFYLPSTDGRRHTAVCRSLHVQQGFISIQTQLKPSTNDALAEAGRAHWIVVGGRS